MSVDLSGKAIYASVDGQVVTWAYCDASKHPNGLKAGLAQQRAFMLCFEPEVYIRAQKGSPTLSLGIHPNGFADMLEIIKACTTTESPAYIAKLGWAWRLNDIEESRKIR